MKVRICHLYGNLLNTYGDNGNLLMLQYVAREMGHEVETTIVSLKEPFIASDYDVVFIGGGQDREHPQCRQSPLLPDRRCGPTAPLPAGGECHHRDPPFRHGENIHNSHAVKLA